MFSMGLLMSCNSHNRFLWSQFASSHCIFKVESLTLRLWSLNILVFRCLLLSFLLWRDLEPQKPTLPTHQLLLLHPLRCSFYREKYQINKRESWRRKGALNTYVIHLLQKEGLGWAKTQSKRDPRLTLKAEIKYGWSWGWERPFWDQKPESWAGEGSPRAP